MILPSHASSYAWQSKCNYSGEGVRERKEKNKWESEWLGRGRRIKQMSIGSVLCSQSTTPPFLAHSVTALCLLTLVSKQLWRLNSRSLTYGVSWGPERLHCVSGSSLDSLTCLFELLPKAHLQTGAGLIFVLVTSKQRPLFQILRALGFRYQQCFVSSTLLFHLTYWGPTVTDRNIVFFYSTSMLLLLPVWTDTVQKVKLLCVEM